MYMRPIFFFSCDRQSRPQSWAKEVVHAGGGRLRMLSADMQGILERCAENPSNVSGRRLTERAGTRRVVSKAGRFDDRGDFSLGAAP